MCNCRGRGARQEDNRGSGAPLIRCSSCGSEHQDEAQRCVECGAPLERELLVSSASPHKLKSSGPPPPLPAQAARQSLSPQTVLANRYRILRSLKAGGMGAVYLASDSHLGGRLCAIKEMIDNFASDDERRDGQAWFAREAQMLGRLRHPCIPEIYDYFME